MADEEWTETELKKKSKISVTVEEILADIIVVSFCYQGKLFQGVLLDSRKKLLPCGIIAPAHEGPPLGTATLPLEDKLFSASQRYSYFQEKTSPNVDRFQMKRNIRPPARFKNARMTVRLRPRQVLCSKCRGICNENSENVDVSSKKRKYNETESSPSKSTRPERRLRSSGEISPRPVFPDNPPAQPKKDSHSQVPQPNKKKLCLSPKLTLLPTNENSINGRVQKIKIVGSYWLKEDEHVSDCMSPSADESSKKVDILGEEEDPLSLTVVDGIPHTDTKCGPPSGNEDEVDPLAFTAAPPPRVLRKKRSVGSMEDLWDETVFKETSSEKKAQANKAKTPVIKISFGSGTGEGTVVKIPAKSHDIPSESESEEKKREKTKRDASAKAAKKALKKAKKEARRKVIEGASPARSLGGTSPRYPCLSPRYFAACMSPRQTIGNASPAYEIFHKKHKHKVKHKKRHKDDKKHKEVDEGEEEAEGKEDSIRECLKQKLSINLKRLNSNAYMRCTSSSPSASDGSDEQSDAVPDFPGNPLVIRASSQPITSCETGDGRHVTVGDVVWGKIHGFPWWPGKVLSITASRKEDGGCSSPQAHVAWYGSSTSSLMSCDQLNPFLESFQVRYNKKKRGPYKEAIKQATAEARREDVDVQADIHTDVLPSPTEVDVVS